MNAIASSAALFSLVFAGATFAQTATPVHRMSEHPAVIVKRNAAKQGYDYASKFYPHPAWMYLQSGPTPGQCGRRCGAQARDGPHDDCFHRRHDRRRHGRDGRARAVNR